MAQEIAVLVCPRSSQRRVERLEDGSLKVWVHAAAVDGEANKAVLEALAEFLGVRVSALSIKSGHTSRKKRIVIGE